MEGGRDRNKTVESNWGTDEAEANNVQSINEQHRELSEFIQKLEDEISTEKQEKEKMAKKIAENEQENKKAKKESKMLKEDKRKRRCT